MYEFFIVARLLFSFSLFVKCHILRVQIELYWVKFKFLKLNANAFGNFIGCFNDKSKIYSFHEFFRHTKFRLKLMDFILHFWSIDVGSVQCRLTQQFVVVFGFNLKRYDAACDRWTNLETQNKQQTISWFFFLIFGALWFAQ